MTFEEACVGDSSGRRVGGTGAMDAAGVCDSVEGAAGELSSEAGLAIPGVGGAGAAAEEGTCSLDAGSDGVGAATDAV